MIHGEEDFEDSDSEIGGDGGGGCGGGGGGGAPSNSDNESGAADTRSWPLGRGFVRVQWYPEGTKQDVRETKVTFMKAADYRIYYPNVNPIRLTMSNQLDISPSSFLSRLFKRSRNTFVVAF